MTTEHDPLASAYLDYDLDDAAEEKARQEAQSEAEAQIFVKHQDGENILRILPVPAAWSEWFADQGLKPTPFFLYWSHFWEHISKKGTYISFACPLKMANRRCPVCEEVSELLSSPSELDQELGDKMKVKHKAMCNVIDRRIPDAGPLIWEMSAPFGRWKGKTMYEKVRALMEGRAKREIVRPGAQGHDIIVTKNGDGSREGTSYVIQVDPVPCQLSTSDDQALAWILSQHDLRQKIIPPTPDQLSDILAGRGRRMTAAPSGAAPQRTALPQAQPAAHAVAAPVARPVAPVTLPPTQPPPAKSVNDYVDTDDEEEDDLVW